MECFYKFITFRAIKNKNRLNFKNNNFKPNDNECMKMKSQKVITKNK